MLKQQVEEHERSHATNHPFTSESQFVDVNPHEHPLVAVKRELARAKSEMEVVYNLMSSVNIRGSGNKPFLREVRYVRHKETEQDEQVSERTHMANLVSCQLLFREASSMLEEKAKEIEQTIQR